MKPWDLFNKLRHVPYIKVGKDLDFFIFSDDSEKIIHVMFQESSSTLDWIINFLFPIVPAIIGGSPYWVALGWWLSWSSARELVMQSIGCEILNHPDYEVRCEGFSYGGAVAQICGIEVFERFGVKPTLETFGAPKPLFTLWSKLMARRCYKSIRQWANWSDIVTWCIPLPGYYHVGSDRVGKFSLKGLFDPWTEHQRYKDPALYPDNI